MGRPSAGADEAGFVGDDDELCAVTCVELRQQAADVGLRGGMADVEAFGDLGVGQAAGDEGQHLRSSSRGAGPNSGASRAPSSSRSRPSSLRVSRSAARLACSMDDSTRAASSGRFRAGGLGSDGVTAGGRPCRGRAAALRAVRAARRRAWELAGADAPDADGELIVLRRRMSADVFA
jgi:hypothetical protein